MNPKRQLRRLRHEERWIGSPPPRVEAPSGPGRRIGAARPAIVTALVFLLVAGLSIATVRAAAMHPAHTPAPAPSLATPSRGPAPTATAGTDTFRCGQTIPDSAFRSQSSGSIALPHDTGSAFIWITNYAASHGGTAVGAVVAGGVPGESDAARTPWSGRLRVALVRDGSVIALATGAASSGAVGLAETASVAATMVARSCVSGAPLPDGRYEIAATGVSLTLHGKQLTPIVRVRWVDVSRGLLIGGLETLPGGPWGGSGVPRCGTAVDSASISAFVAQSRTVMDAAGLRLRFTGSQVHANGRGFDFTTTLTSEGRTIGGSPSVTIRRIGATTVIAHGRIQSAPSSGGTEQQIPFTRLAAGKSVSLGSDAPDTACGISADGTFSYPALPDSVHTAYIEFGVTSTGIPIVALVRYVEATGDRPKIVG